MCLDARTPASPLRYPKDGGVNLDKSYLTYFENISVPMRQAVTIPVEGEPGVRIYICASNSRATKNDVLRVARALTLKRPRPYPRHSVKERGSHGALRSSLVIGHSAQ